MQVGVLHPDSGWILSHIAQRLCEAMPDVFKEWTWKRLQWATPKDVGMLDAVYYIDVQNCWNPGLMTAIRHAKHVGAFTHLDRDEDTSFRAGWEQLDGVVHMCQRYYDRFLANGWYRADQMAVIRPGEVGHISLQPVRIGIVQRGEHVGKGAEFLPAVLDSLSDEIKAGLQLIICGEGWAQDAALDNLPWQGTESDKWRRGKWHGVRFQSYPERMYAEMPAEYDYLLIPSLWEGGPMALLEALAAGRQVIAADVGWVREFFPIHCDVGHPAWNYIYAPGDVDGLASILTEVVGCRLRTRAKVEAMSYRRYAEDVLAFIDGLGVQR